MASGSPDTIRIIDLRVKAFIGVLGFEKDERQTLRFDIEIETVPGYVDSARQGGEYVSYSDAVEFIEAKAARDEHVELVEEWALSVAEFVLENPLVRRVTVSVEKPDIFENVAGVGIRIVREKAYAQ